MIPGGFVGGSEPASLAGPDPAHRPGGRMGCGASGAAPAARAEKTAEVQFESKSEECINTNHLDHLEKFSFFIVQIDINSMIFINTHNLSLLLKPFLQLLNVTIMFHGLPL